jgi:DUF1680 family protein
MERPDWLSLNGLWQLALVQAGEAPPKEHPADVLVPFPVESSLSGVGKQAERIEYRRTFEVPKGWAGKHVLLHFDAVNWEAKVSLNGKELGTHRGGYDAFSFDVTDALKKDGPQELIVAVWNPADAGVQPRGKQVHRPGGIWYTPSTGIWQTVWLEPVAETSIESLKVVGDPAGKVTLNVAVAGPPKGATVDVAVSDGGKDLVRIEKQPADKPVELTIPSPKAWTPDTPTLYDLRVELSRGGEKIDQVKSYLGLRKIEVGKDDKGVTRILLNGKFVFQVGLLDQGFWPDGIYTAPTDDALKSDIEMTKKLGFNLARKHVKVEPERWYYWCDKLGLLVWQDMPSGDQSVAPGKGEITRSKGSAEQYELELKRMIDGRHNHPCIVTWVPFNEGWGQFDTARVVEWIKKYDPTRLVDCASGWNDFPVGDFHDVHVYPGPGSPEPEEKRAAVLGEFGGLGLGVEKHTWSPKTWGYRGVRNGDDLTFQYEGLLRKVYELKDKPGLSAVVYTQTTDVEEEANGMMTYDRAVVKGDVERIAAANRGDFSHAWVTEEVVPTSRAEGQSWRYNFKGWIKDWYKPDFDAKDWMEGQGGFGTKGTPGAVVRTEWSTAEIWMRHEFVLPEGKLNNPHLLLHHDEDAEVYLNGVIAAKVAGFITDYQEVPISAEALKTLKPGRNVFAVHCRQTTGGQYIDVGLVDIKPPAKRGGMIAVPFKDVQVTDDFWGKRIRTNRTATVEANLRQCEVTGRIKNFAVAGKLVEGKHEGALYNDSDVYKVLEGVAYALAEDRDEALEKRADKIIDQIAAAQQSDGYLNTYYTLVEPQNRWKNIQYGHELYCAGHLIEAAVAYQQATGKTKLLDVARKLADNICDTFGPGKKIEACGHEELELALVKLYRATGEKKYLEQAKFFLDVRGTAEGRKPFGDYAQDHKPVREQTEVTGHAVRATYLYCGMADVAALTGDEGLRRALESIWHDMVDRKMYVTGGIGPSASNEGFTVPYDLPNDRAYAETCAAIGMALWNHRMFLMSGDGKYADVLEREVYNGLLSGVSLSGDRFFYVNPLGSKGSHHRVEWFGTSCCPTNVVRYVPGMGERMWARAGNGVWAVLYAGNSTTVPLDNGKVKLKEETKYPWDGEVTVTVEPEKELAFDLHLRVPGWCEEAPTLTVNGERQPVTASKGYVTLSRQWKAGDSVKLVLPMPVQRVYADPHVKADVGRVALMRGPVVYCLEGVDNGGSVRNLVLPKEAKLEASFEKDLLTGVTVIRGEALKVTADDDDRQVIGREKFQAVPYFAWDNRKPGEMAVWLPEDTLLAEVPGHDGVFSNGVLVRASHCWQADTVEALNDGVLPKSSKDHDLPRMTWWDHKGTTEWVAYRFGEPRRLTSAKVYWFDDTGVGECRVPAEWRLLYLDGKEWKPVKLAEKSAYATALDTFNEVEFEEVKTRELRLEVTLKKGFSGGILEWSVAGPK